MRLLYVFFVLGIVRLIAGAPPKQGEKSSSKPPSSPSQSKPSSPSQSKPSSPSQSKPSSPSQSKPSSPDKSKPSSPDKSKPPSTDKSKPSAKDEKKTSEQKQTAGGKEAEPGSAPPPEVERCDFKMDSLENYPGKNSREKAIFALLALESTTVEGFDGFPPKKCLKDFTIKERGVPAIVVTNRTTPEEIKRSATESHLFRLLSVDNAVLKDDTITVFFHCVVKEKAQPKQGAASNTNMKIILKNPEIKQSGSDPFNLAETINQQKEKKFEFTKVEEFSETSSPESIRKIFEDSASTLSVEILGDENVDGKRVALKVELKIPAPCAKGKKQTALKGYIVPTVARSHEATTGKGAAGSKQPTSGSKQPTSGSKQPTSGSKQPTSGSKQPTSGSKQPTSGSKQPTSGSKQPTSGSKQGGASPKGKN